MNRTTFETVTADELTARHDAYWLGALSAAGVPELDASEDPAAGPFSAALPYRAAFEAYGQHVEHCAACGESFMDQCPEGDRLSDLAAKAMVAQEAVGAQQ